MVSLSPSINYNLSYTLKLVNCIYYKSSREFNLLTRINCLVKKRSFTLLSQNKTENSKEMNKPCLRSNKEFLSSQSNLAEKRSRSEILSKLRSRKETKISKKTLLRKTISKKHLTAKTHQSTTTCI